METSEVIRAMKDGAREITDFTVVVSYLTNLELQSEEEIKTLRGLLNAVRKGTQLRISSGVSDDLLAEFKAKASRRC